MYDVNFSQVVSELMLKTFALWRQEIVEGKLTNLTSLLTKYPSLRRYNQVHIIRVGVE